MRRAVRIGLLLAVAAVVYLALAVLAVWVAGEVSCYEVCSPTSEFLNDTAPWPAVAAGVVSLAVGAAVARPWRG